MIDVRSKLADIRQLVSRGVLEPVRPSKDYWSWTIAKPDDLPERFKTDEQLYGEVRSNGHTY